MSQADWTMIDHVSPGAGAPHSTGCTCLQCKSRPSMPARVSTPQHPQGNSFTVSRPSSPSNHQDFFKRVLSKSTDSCLSESFHGNVFSFSLPTAREILVHDFYNQPADASLTAFNLVEVEALVLKEKVPFHFDTFSPTDWFRDIRDCAQGAVAWRCYCCQGETIASNGHVPHFLLCLGYMSMNLFQ